MLPALWHRDADGQVPPDSRIFAISRKPLDDDAYREQSSRSRDLLRSRFGGGADPSYELAAWSIAHGLAELILAGAVPAEVRGDRAAIRAILGHLAPS